MRRSLRILPLALLFITAFSDLAFANLSGEVINISRRLKMTAAEAQPPKEFYLNRGEENGVKPGDVFEVYREIAVMDAVNGAATSLIRIPLGELKVTLVGQYASIARASAIKLPADLPVLDYPMVMLGDQVVQKQSLPFQTQAP